MTYSLDKGAIKGGVSGGDPDLVSVGTGFLYRHFALGTLDGLTTLNAAVPYNYTSSRADHQQQLQNAIWCLEGEITACGVSTDGTSSTNVFLNAAINKFGTFSLAKADGGWQYGVFALNLYKTDATGNITGYYQSQLFSVPDGGATLSLLGAALLGLGALRRKLN
jgi:hypothetical protein